MRISLGYICEQHLRRLVGTIVVHCPDSITTHWTFYIQSFKILASLCSWVGSRLVPVSNAIFLVKLIVSLR